MIPLDITPMAPIQRPSLSYISEFANSLDKQGDERKQRELEFLKMQMGNAIQQGQLGVSQQNANTSAEETRGKNDYYKMQGETHRMDVEDRSKARDEKRLAQLRDAFRKAKTPAEKKLIMQEIARSGAYTLEEVGTAAAETPGGDPTEKGKIPNGSTVASEDPAKKLIQDPSDSSVQWEGAAPGSPGTNANVLPKKAPVPSDADNNGSTFATPFDGPPGFQTPTPDPKFMAALAAEVGGTKQDSATPSSARTELPPLDIGAPVLRPDLKGQQVHDFRQDPTAAEGPLIDASTLPEDQLPLSLRQGGTKWNPDARAFESGAAGEPATKPPDNASPGKGSGRYLLKDKSGNVVDIWDQGAEDKQDRDMVAGYMKPLIGHAKDPSSKAHAEEALDVAMSGVQLYGPQEAAKLGAAEFHRLEKEGNDAARVGQGQQRIDMKKGRGGGGGGVPGVSKLSIKLDDQANALVEKVKADVSRDFKVPAERNAMNVAQGAVAKLDDAIKNPSGMMQLAALKDYFLVVSGKTVTDDEMDKFLNSTGAWNSIKMKLARYTDEGQMPPDFARQLKGMLLKWSANSAKNMKRAGQTAADAIRGMRFSGATPEQMDEIANNTASYFTGDYGWRKPVAPKPSGKPSASPAAPSATPASSEMDERARFYNLVPNE